MMKKQTAKEEKRSIVFYDGECGLCEKSVRMIWKQDQEGVFHFASLQSRFAHSFLHKQHGMTEVVLNTMYLHHDGELYQKSGAVAMIGKYLEGGPIKVIGWLFRNCPNKELTDKLYDLVARNRHMLGKKKEVCEVPPADVVKRFLD